jgi:hypothetical protein
VPTPPRPKPIPFRLTAPQFQERYARGLERLSPIAIATLRAHLALPVEAGVDRAEVQIFPGADDPHEPAVWIYYLGPHNKVDGTDATLHAGRSLELALGLGQLEPFDTRYYTSDTFGGLDIVARALRLWFAQCWWKAGGWTYPTPTMLHLQPGWGDGKALALTERSA